MREIVSLHVGQCGLQVGAKFWEIAACEHGLDANGFFCGLSAHQLERIEVYFDRGCYDKYTPRAVLVDLENGVLDYIRVKTGGFFFKPESFFTSHTGAGNCWARGFYTDGCELSYEILESIRKDVECCDCLQGFQLTHSIGGGTGSGVGSLLLTKLREEYPDRIMSTHTVIPSPKISDVVVEPYNAILSMHHLMENTDMTIMIDNEALFNISCNTLKLKKPVFKEINHLIGNTIAGITTSFRFPGQLNADLRKLCVNMIPFPRMHFMVPAFSPLTSPHEKSFLSSTFKAMVDQLIDPKSLMAAINIMAGRFFTMAAIFRGRISTRQVDEYLTNVRVKNKMYFIDWIPTNIHATICDIPCQPFLTSGTLLTNSTANKTLLKRLTTQFCTLYSRKAFLNWYLGEGMEEEEFHLALNNIKDIMQEYEQYEAATGDEDTE